MPPMETPSSELIQNLDVNKLNKMAEDIKNSQGAGLNVIDAYEMVDDKEQQEEMKQSIECFEDIAQDSYYPLMTNDPAIKKEYILKITDEHLDKVFDKNNN